MPGPARRPRWFRLRWIAVAIGIVVLAVLTAGVIHIDALLQPQRFTSLLQRELAGVGIELNLTTPARPTLFPHPALRLGQFSLTNAGASTPLLRASGATIAVPWSALLHGDAAIGRVVIDTPRIDLGELRALLARLPHHRGPPRLPTIASGVHLTAGTLTNAGTPLLFEVNVDTGELVPGQRFRMDASARSAAGTTIDATLDTVPSTPHAGSIDFAPLTLDFTREGGAKLHLAGHATWRGGNALTLALVGTLRYGLPAPAASTAAPAGQPPASARPAGATTTARVAVDIQPPKDDAPIAVAIKLDGAGTQADLKLEPTRLVPWSQRVLAASPTQPAGPLPVTGHVTLKALDLGSIKATGVKLDAVPEPAPAASTSTAPASASSVAR